MLPAILSGREWRRKAQEELRATSNTLGGADQAESLGSKAGDQGRQIVLQIVVPEEALRFPNVDIQVEEQRGGSFGERSEFSDHLLQIGP
jgi:hypothetical protein